MPATEDEPWVEIRRFDDPLQAEMVKDFLRDHGVRVSTRGNAGTTAVLNRFATVVDIRIDVPESEVDAAREALSAMDVGSASEQPFRGLSPVDREAEDYAPPRRVATAMMLGFIVPIGAGHFYARHDAAGAILLSAIIGAGLGVMLGLPQLGLAWAILALVDIFGSRWAVHRYNAREVPPEGTQRLAALVAVALAFAAAFALTR